MSDCSNSSMQPYDVARLRIEFQDGEVPWMYPLALNGRTISGVYVDNERYERVRECKVIDFIEHALMDEPDIFELSCGHDVMAFGIEERPSHCPNCGAKVVEDGE